MNPNPAIRALLISGDAVGGQQVATALRAELRPRPVIRRVPTLTAGLECLRRFRYEIVLLDLQAATDGSSPSVGALHAAAPELPVVVLGDEGHEAAVFAAMRAGAQDYLIKERSAPHLIAKSVQYAMERKRTARALAAAEARQMENEALLRAFYDSPGVLRGIVEIIAGRMHTVSCNAAAAAFFGRKTAGRGRPPTAGASLPPDIARTLLKHYEESRRAAASVRFEYEHPCPDGNRWLHAAVSYLGKPTGGQPRFAYAMFDITDRKAVEEELRQATAELERRVAERTATLNTTVAALRAEVDQRLRAENELLANQRKLRALMSELILAEEKERRRIAHGLHEEIGQMLVMAKLHVAEITETGGRRPTAAREAAAELDQSLDRVLAATRSLTFDLVSPVLQKLGLEAAVRGYCKRLEDDQGIRCDFRRTGLQAALPGDQEILLFHTVRELLRNVVKHARAHRVDVQLACTVDGVRITVQDDGVGCDVAALNFTTRGGYGLFSIRERAQGMGGTFRVEPVTPHGTRITLNLPITPGSTNP